LTSIKIESKPLLYSCQTALAHSFVV